MLSATIAGSEETQRTHSCCTLCVVKMYGRADAAKTQLTHAHSTLSMQYGCWNINTPAHETLLHSTSLGMQQHQHHVACSSSWHVSYADIYLGCPALHLTD